MTVLEMRKWVNSLPKEFDTYQITHREYYDSSEDILFANEVPIVSIHIDDVESNACLMHEASYLKYKGDDIYNKIKLSSEKVTI